MMGWKPAFFTAISLLMAATTVLATEPCDYLDTVDITNSIKFANGSYSYNGLLLEPHEVAEYSYVMKFKDVKVPAAPHMRGCVCLKRPCINLCCPWKQKWNFTSEVCVPDLSVNYVPMANVSIDGFVEFRNLQDVFALQSLRIAEKLWYSTASLGDPFVIYKNGTVFRTMDGFTDKNDYCLVNAMGELGVAKPPVGAEEYEMNSKLTAYAQLFSIPFMILTIIVYFYIGEVRKNYMKAFICYLFGLSIGFLSLTLKTVVPAIRNAEHETLCKLSAYTSYYAFMMAFFALNAISYDIWHNFRGTRRYENDLKFSIYALYIFGMPMIMLIMTAAAQEFEFCPVSLKPGFGIDTGCWLNNADRIPPFIYFFGPMLILVLANITMFAMTAYKLYKLEKKYITTTTTRSNTMKNLRTEKARHGLFLRLFLLMGVLWIFEAAAYLAGHTVWAHRFFLFFDILNALQGLIIFVLFVLRKPVRRVLLSKLCKNEYIDTDSEGSYTVNGNLPTQAGAAELLNLRETEAA